MRLVAVAVALMIASPAVAADDMAGWYMVMINQAGRAIVNESPMSEAGCRQQVAIAHSMSTQALAECVELRRR